MSGAEQTWSSEDRGCPVIHYDFDDTTTIDEVFANLDRIREAAPLVWNGFASGYWVASSYELVRYIYHDTATFSSSSIDPLNPDPKVRSIPTNVDGEDHARYRQLLNPWFTRARVQEIQGQLRAVARSRIDEMAPRGRSEFISDFALLFPTQSLLLMIGFPLEDADRLVPVVNDYFAGMHGLDKQRQAEANRRLVAYCQHRLDHRRSGGPLETYQDFIGYLLQDRTFGRPLRDDEILELCKVQVIAGLHTTRGQLGFLFHRLATDSDLQRQLREDPTLIPQAVEESLRMHGIITRVARKVTSDVTIGTCTLRAGEMISMAPAAAGRDPQRFAEPTRFDLHRAPNTNLAFGAGPHRCLGLHLARLEMTVALDTWLARVPTFSLVGAPGPVVGGILCPTSIELEWDPTRS
jgi:cytochrome P450